MEYLIQNFTKSLASAPAAVATGSPKTMLQIKPILPIYLVEWGYFFDGSPSDIRVELIEVDQPATVTVHADDSISKITDVSDGPAASSYMTLSTTATGFTATGEGSAPTIIRYLDPVQVTSMKAYVKQWALGKYPLMQTGLYTRIRVTAAAAVNMFCYCRIGTSNG